MPDGLTGRIIGGPELAHHVRASGLLLLALDKFHRSGALKGQLLDQNRLELLVTHALNCGRGLRMLDLPPSGPRLHPEYCRGDSTGFVARRNPVKVSSNLGVETSLSAIKFGGVILRQGGPRNSLHRTYLLLR